MVSPTKWQFGWDENCLALKLGRVLRCERWVENEGFYYTSFEATDSDPPGLIKINVSIGDSEPEEFIFILEKRFR